jgi:hypothetical protein
MWSGKSTALQDLSCRQIDGSEFLFERPHGSPQENVSQANKSQQTTTTLNEKAV